MGYFGFAELHIPLEWSVSKVVSFPWEASIDLLTHPTGYIKLFALETRGEGIIVPSWTTRPSFLEGSAATNKQTGGLTRL